MLSHLDLIIMSDNIELLENLLLFNKKYKISLQIIIVNFIILNY